MGLAAACALADCGLKVLLVDAGKRTGKDNELEVNAEKPKFDPRVSALDSVFKESAQKVRSLG